MSEKSQEPNVEHVDFCNKLNELLDEKLSGIPLRRREQTLLRSLVDTAGDPSRLSEEDYDTLHAFIVRIQRTAAEHELVLREPLGSVMPILVDIMERENKRLHDLLNIRNYGAKAIRMHPEYNDLTLAEILTEKARIRERERHVLTAIRTAPKFNDDLEEEHDEIRWRIYALNYLLHHRENSLYRLFFQEQNPDALVYAL